MPTVIYFEEDFAAQLDTMLSLRYKRDALREESSANRRFLLYLNFCVM